MRSLPSRKNVTISLIIILAFALVPAAWATIVVKPGKLDHFAITLLNKPVAGEYFIAKLEAFDSQGNFITEYTGPGEGFSIKVTGQATVTPAVIKAREFSGGLVAKIMDEKAEEIELTVLEISGNVPIASLRIRVEPNKLDHFDVTSQRQVTAGEHFQVRVVARDVFGNLIAGYQDQDKKVGIDFTGIGGVKSQKALAPVFKSGEASMEFQAEKTGDLKISVRDKATGSAGETAPLKIVPAKADHFSIVAPRAAVAGEAFNISITVFDRFGNPVVDFNKEHDAVVLSSSTGRQLEPGTVEAGGFREGSAVIEAFYTKAESFKIIAEGKAKGPRGESEFVNISSAEPDHFILNTPNMAVAGEPFKVTIEAMDRFNNIINDYHLIGTEVFLSADGSGELSPSTVTPSRFKEGKAEFMLTYSKAESFNLMAELKEKVRKRTTSLEPSREMTERLKAEQAQRELEAKMEAQRQSERELAEKAREEALRAKEDALRAKEKAEAAKEKAEAAKEESEQEKARKARYEAYRQKEKPEAVTTTVPQEREVEISRPPAIEIEKILPDERKPAPSLQVAIPTVQQLVGISMMEARDEAVILLKLTGPVNYDVSSTSTMAHEWIFVDINPAVRDMTKVVSKMITDSTLIGQIKTREKGDDKVEVAIEILPKNVAYSVEQDGDAIVVKVTKVE